MQRRKDEVAGECGLNGHLGRGQVAHLTDHDDVRVLPQQRLHAAGEIEIDVPRGAVINLNRSESDVRIDSVAKVSIELQGLSWTIQMRSRCPHHKNLAKAVVADKLSAQSAAKERGYIDLNRPVVAQAGLGRRKPFPLFTSSSRVICRFFLIGTNNIRIGQVLAV